MIHQLKLSLSNAYVIQEKGTILVDSGAPGEYEIMASRMAKHHIVPEQIKLIVHTHVHHDHVGSSKTFQETNGTPTTYHQADQSLMQRGSNGKLSTIGFRGRFFSRFYTDAPFYPFKPTFFVEDGTRLDEYGIAGSILHTPSSTWGSVSVVLDSGEAIIGDLLMGGYLGGLFSAQRPMYHYFSIGIEEVHESLERLLNLGVQTFYVGHGGPLSADQVEKRFSHRL